MANNKPIILYPKGIRGISKLPIGDLKVIAQFNKIVINYVKMKRFLKEDSSHANK